MIDSLYLSLLCLSAALLCYTGFQNYSLIRSISCSCSTCCFGLGFQHQKLQDFIKIIRALIKDFFLRWKQLYANSRFCQLLRVLVKVAIDRARLVLIVPEGKKWRSKGTKWKELLERLSVSKIILPDLPMYSQDGSEETLRKPAWRTCLYLLDGDTKPILMEELNQGEVQWVTRQSRGWRKAKMLSKLSDHPEVKWEEQEPVVSPPTLDVESNCEGEKETCTANTGDNMRDRSVSRIPIHDSEVYKSVKWDNLLDIPPQRGEVNDQAKCILAFACMAAEKTTRS